MKNFVITKGWKKLKSLNWKWTLGEECKSEWQKVYQMRIVTQKATVSRWPIWSTKFFTMIHMRFMLLSPKKTYKNNKEEEDKIGDTWSMDLFDMNDYIPRRTKGYKLDFVVFNIFSRIRWTVLFWKKSELLKDSLEKIISPTRKKPICFETDDAKDFVNFSLGSLDIEINIKKQNRYNSKVSFFAENYREQWESLMGSLILWNGILKEKMKELQWQSSTKNETFSNQFRFFQASLKTSKVRYTEYCQTEESRFNKNSN